MVSGRDEEAAELLRPAVSTFPQRPELHFNLALACRRLGWEAEAVNHYREVVSLAPDLIAAHMALGELLYGRGEVSAAVTHWERALELDPDAALVLNSLAWVFATSSETRGAEVFRAVSMAARACDLTAAADPSYLDTLAAALARAGRFDEAVDTAGRAAELARASGRTGLAVKIEGRAALYRQGRDLRSTSGR